LAARNLKKKKKKGNPQQEGLGERQMYELMGVAKV